MRKIDKETLKQIKEDLRLYFEFLELYDKPRPPRVKSQIDEYIKKDPSIMGRIRFIENIDRKEKKKGKTKKEEIVISTPSKDKKKVLKRSSFLNFLFGDMKPVKAFGQRTRTLIIRFFGFIRKNPPETSVEWARYRSDIENLLFKPFSYVVTNGWRYLDRLHYNVCVAFAGFINSFVKNSMSLNKGKPENHIMVFEDCLPYYLQIVTNDTYKTILIEAMEETISKISVGLDNAKYVMPFLKDIIDTRPDTQNSFLNIILSIYMLYYRSFINLQKLSKFFKLPPINSDRYNLHKKLKPVVKEEVRKARERYNHANKALFFIKPVDQDLRLRSDKHNKIVRNFNRLCVTNRELPTLDKVENPMMSNPFNFIEEDLAGVMMRFLSGFDMTYGDILVSKIYVKTGNERKKVNIFSERLFRWEIDKIKDIAKNYELMKQASEFSTITMKTYKNHLDGVRASSDKEDKLCWYTKEAFEALHKIKDNLTEVLYNHFLAGSLRGTELLEVKKTQDYPINKIEESKPRFLPHATDQVIINRYHEGKKVKTVIDEIVSILANLDYLFEEPVTLQTIEKEEELLRKCEEELLTITKIG